MECCVVPGCKSNSSVNPELGFFTLPEDEALLMQWTTTMGIAELISTPDHIKVCGLHFEEKSFQTRDNKKLHRGAIPTILHQPDEIERQEGSSENKKSHVGVDVSLSDWCEPLFRQFLSRSNITKEDFENEYKKFYHGKAEAKELYHQIFIEFERTISEGNIDNFKKLSNLIGYISNVENQQTLKNYYDNVTNPISSTNLVILACKHNKVKILEYLFGSDGILNDLSIGIMRTALLPDDEDETHHNAFYYAIRSSSTELLDTLINNYFAVHCEKLDEILSKAYEELKLKNVPLSDEMEIFVENKLINLRFFSVTSGQDQSFRGNHNNIRNRIEIILQNISLLKTDYSNAKEVDAKFLFVTKSIAQNIHILKRQLKSTYDRLPWEEMEFCLVSFVSSHMKRQKINLFHPVAFNKNIILNHLKEFAKKLEDEIDTIKDMNISKLACLPNIKREKIVENIICSNPEFEELYIDYQQIRDIHSLEKISDCIKLASSADPTIKEGQLIIMRVLQVIGEHLKNTLESPKLSNTTSELLLLSLPKNAREVIIDLRNSLSHANSLSKRIKIEENKDAIFFTNIQNDTKKVGDVINNILRNNKIKTVKLFLQKIVSSDSFDEIKEIGEIFRNANLDEMIPENFKMMEHEKLEKLIEELNDKITDKTIYEKFLFNVIHSIISAGTKFENITYDYFTGLASLQRLNISLRDFKIDQNTINGIKFHANHTLKNINSNIEPCSLKEISLLSMNIYKSFKTRSQHNIDEINRIICEIFYVTEIGTGDIKWIEELREKFNERNSFIPKYKQRKINNMTEETYNNQLTLKLFELKNVLSNNLLSGKSNKNIPYYKSDKKIQSVVEMLVMDIMSILDSSMHNLVNNHLFLDENTPLLTGKCLRNHLAHNNALINILLPDPSTAVILNAKKLIEENITINKNKIGKFVSDDPLKWKQNYEQNLVTITNQERMFVASEEGNIEKLKDCLKKGTDINARSINSWTTLHFAAKGPSLEVVNFILDQNLSVNVKDKNNQSLLHIAAAYGRKNTVEFFIKEAGLYVDSPDNSGKRPLHIAAKNGHKDTVKVLLKNKACTVTRDCAGLSPLHYAIRNNHTDVAKTLLETDANVDDNEASGGFTPLHEAAEKGNFELVNFLLKKKAAINASNDRGWTPLHAAALNGHLEVVNALILRGADVNARLITGCTPLHFAVEDCHEKITNILLKYGSNVNAADKKCRCTPLHYAAKNGYEGIVKILLEFKANASVSTYEDKTPLHFAAQNGHLEIVTILLKYGVNIHVNDKNNATPLHYAILCGHKKVAEILIKYGVEINSKNNTNLTSLHIASLKGHEDITDLLIKNKANITAQDNKGATPLHAAAKNGSKVIIDLLIKVKAEVNARTYDNTTPLHMAALSGHRDAIDFLIKNKAEVNATDDYGFTPLHSAILNGHKDIVSILIMNKAQVDAADIKGFTPLEIAVISGHTEIVKILLANGANVNFNAPLCSAVKHNHKEIVEVLIANGANVDVEDGKPLLVAVLTGNRDIVDILIKNKARVDIKGPENSEILHLALVRGDKKIVNTLILKGADVNAIATNSMTPLHLAAEQGFEEIVKIFIENRANINAISTEGTALRIAAACGHNNVVKILLNNKAEVNIKDIKERTAIELAVVKSHLQVVKTLLQHKEVDINAKGTDDRTLLHIAAQQSNLDIVKYLIDKGSDIHAKNSKGSQPIHVAAREGYIHIVEFLLNKGSSINDLGAIDHTLLHYAAINGQSEVVKYLIAQSLDVNVKDAEGSSPMHAAAFFGKKNVIEVLLKNGAVYNAINKRNKKPLDMATDQDVINLLASTDKLFETVKRNNSSEVENNIKAGAFVNAININSGTPLHYAAYKGFDRVVNALLQNKANPNIVCKKGFTPLHYAAKFSHLKVVKALLSNSAVYNAMSYSGKTPSDLTVDISITNLLKLISESFQNVINDNYQVVIDLNKIKDIGTVKAIMCARNTDNQTLVVAAMHNNFSKIEELKQTSQGDISAQISIAGTFVNQGNYQKALSIFKSLFENRKEILGLDNPGTLDIQTHIAKTLYVQGAYKDALSTFEDIFQKQKKILGMNNKYTLSTRSAIALVLHRQEKNEEAFNIYQEVYQKQKEILERDHSDILDTQFHMALVLDGQGKYEEALNINREIFEKYKNNLGANNASTVLVQNNIGMVLANQGKYEEALEIYKEVFEKKKVIYGINHTLTLRTLHNIATILSGQKKYKQALKAFQEVLNIQKNILGLNHPDTLNSQCNMANLLFADGKWTSAFQVYREILDQTKIVFGSDHPIVLDILGKIKVLNRIFQSQGNQTSEVIQNLRKDINVAASIGDIQTVQRLLKDGANVNDKDVDGITLLHYAASGGQTGVVNSLLEMGADVTQVSNKGNTPLHTATSKGFKEIVEVLLQHANHNKLYDFINAKTTASGVTSLHVAAKKGFLDVTKSLLKQGAIYNIKNNEGKTPLDLSKDENITSLLKLVDELYRDAKNGNIEIISKIQEVKPDEFVVVTNARNIQGNTLLQVAETNNKNVARKLSEILRKANRNLGKKAECKT